MPRKLSDRLKAVGICLRVVLSGLCVIWALEGTAQPAEPSDRLSWNGTVRMRWQGDLQKGANALNVLQYGLRLNANLRVNDRIGLTGRLMTGDPIALPVAEWVNVGDFNIRRDPHISWLYATIKPVPSVSLIAGKFPMPFFKPTEVVMDSDLSPEGLAQQILVENSDQSAAFGLNLAEIIINHTTSRTNDITRPYFIGAQALGRFTQPGRSQTIAVALYAIGVADSIFAAQNLKSPVLIRAPNSNRANATGTGYLSDFRVVNVSARYTQQVAKMPLTFNFDYLYNLGADNMRQGITGMITYGSTGTVGDTQFGGQAFHMGQDATLSAFSSIDYSQTNTNGFGLFLGHHLIENLVVDVIFYFRKFDSPGTLISPATNNAWRTRGRFMLTIRI